MFVMVYILSNMVIQIESNKFKQGVQTGKSLVAEQCLIMSDCHTFQTWTRLDINSSSTGFEINFSRQAPTGDHNFFQSPNGIMR